MSKSKIFMVISIIILGISILLSSMALAYYRSAPTNVTLTFEDDLGAFINYKNGVPILGTDNAILNTGDDYTSGLSTEIEFWKTYEAHNMVIFGHIYLDISSGSDKLLNNPGLKWAVTTNGKLISEGNFVGYSQGQSIPILLNQKLLSEETYFKIYIWLDNNDITSDIEGEKITAVVRCEATSGEYSDIGNQNALFIFNEYNFDYTGDIQSFTVPNNGLYQLEVWGAQGGYGLNDTYRGGYGGYARGEISLTKDDILYIAIGGKGGDRTVKNNLINPGGYNGGGNSYGTANKYLGSGGGATHIATKNYLLSSLSDNISDILITAGGGGAGAYESASYNSTGGDGGGFTGNSGITTNTSYIVGSGGTQINGGTGLSAGSFGQGGNATSDSVGGGGGFYGGGVGRYSSGSGGGSGYIGNSKLFNKVMYCYNCIESNEVDTKTVSTTNVSEEATSNYAKIGNGYAKILNLFSPSSIVRKTFTVGTDYDFKQNENDNMPSGYSVIYSTYDNVNELSIGEYQIMFILKDNNNSKYTYYQKIEVVGG